MPDIDDNVYTLWNKQPFLRIYTLYGHRKNFFTYFCIMMKNNNGIIELNSIDAYNALYGLETLHPLVAVIDLKKAANVVNHVKMHYGIYALYLKQGVNCTLKYGRRNYDYQEGSIVSFAPGQLIGYDSDIDEIKPDVLGVLFHPDLIYGTSLGRKIDNYTFFSYEQNEALHLSLQERCIIIDCFDKIQQELEHPIDKHSRELLCVNIELLLEYCMRFYDRQFITREKINNDILQQFEQELNSYFKDDTILHNGFPTVRYFAEKCCLSPGYFGDLVKKETGKTAQEYIQNKIINISKERIIGSNQNISEIAYTLGFQYPQHFSRLFKRQVGCTPLEYRRQYDLD